MRWRAVCLVVGLPLGALALWLAGGAIVAAAAGSGPTPSSSRADSIYDLDARVATSALPRCGAEPPRLEPLLARGARPRLTRDGAALWFDAQGDTGSRQIHRLRLADGSVSCWSCGEPGDNRRPRPGGRGVVFETDRHASWRHPFDTELHWIEARGDAPKQPSRRLTFAPGPDDHALVAPDGTLVWSRRGAGYEVVSAPLERAHGGIALGQASLLVRGGAAWLAPAAWSADARALALLCGNPFAPLRARALDLATNAEHALGADVADDGVAFSADGGFALVVECESDSLLALLPAAFVVRFASLERMPLYRGTRLRAGPRDGPLEPIALPELERWGAPTGATLAPDGRSAIVGQRRDDGAERLVRVQLGCS